MFDKNKLNQTNVVYIAVTKPLTTLGHESEILGGKFPPNSPRINTVQKLLSFHYDNYNIIVESLSTIYFKSKKFSQHDQTLGHAQL